MHNTAVFYADYSFSHRQLHCRAPEKSRVVLLVEPLCVGIDFYKDKRRVANEEKESIEILEISS